MRLVHLLYASLFVPLAFAYTLEQLALPALCISAFAILLAIAAAAFIYYNAENKEESQEEERSDSIQPEKPAHSPASGAHPAHAASLARQAQSEPIPAHNSGRKMLMALFVPAQKSNGWKSETRARMFSISEN
ncbi:MAG: hypothetical protein WC488_00555 [Candidatus Micrarchaeia archaeon]